MTIRATLHAAGLADSNDNKFNHSQLNVESGNLDGNTSYSDDESSETLNTISTINNNYTTNLIICAPQESTDQQDGNESDGDSGQEDDGRDEGETDRDDDNVNNNDDDDDDDDNNGYGNSTWGQDD